MITSTFFPEMHKKTSVDEALCGSSQFNALTAAPSGVWCMSSNRTGQNQIYTPLEG